MLPSVTPVNKEEKNEILPILESILKTVNNLYSTIEEYEKYLLKKEQISEAKTKEAEFESNRTIGDATKITTNKKENKIPEKGFIEKMTGGLFSVIFAFLPDLITMVNEKKELIKSLPSKLIEITVGIMESITSVFKQFISEPISKFFNITLGAALDTLFIFIGDKIDGIMAIPKTLLNAASLFINELLINSTQTFINFINDLVKDSPLLKKLGITDNLVKTAEAKLELLQNKKAELTTESEKLRTEKAAREKTTISETYDNAVKEKTGKYNKEHVDPMADIIDGSKVQDTRGVNMPKVQGMDDIKAMVKRHEGIRNQAYKDSVGKWTIGVGHLIGDGSSPGEFAGRTLTDKEVDVLFEEDFAKHVKIAERTPGWNLANDSGKAAMIDLAFNMGAWWSKWPNTSKALAQGNFDAAADGLIQSKWYIQIGNRAKEVVSLIKSGKNETNAKLSGSAIAEVPIGKGEQITPKSKQKKSQTQTVVKNNPPTQLPSNVEGISKLLALPDPKAAQNLYALHLG